MFIAIQVYDYQGKYNRYEHYEGKFSQFEEFDSFNEFKQVYERSIKLREENIEL